MITRAKRAYLAESNGAPVDVHARRIVARDINDNSVVQELFSEIAPKVAERPGGYTRVVKLTRRHGDGARMAILELVDYNLEQDTSAVRSRSRSAISRAERVARSRAKQKEAKAAQQVEEEVAEDTAAVEEIAEEIVEHIDEQTEEVQEAAEETAADEPAADEDKGDDDDQADSSEQKKPEA
jgi:large subunit ribosomal protein L17